MKRIFYIILTVAIVLSLSSCATHFGLTSNLNNSTTNVVLQTNNYKIIKKVKGTASGTSVFGIGGSFKPLIEQARSEMLSSANLIGKPRAVINETIEINNKSYVGIVNVHTVTVSAYVVEFTNSGVVVEDDDDEVGIKGKWIRQKDGLEITFDADGKVGVFTQIKSGEWLDLLNKGIVNIGDPKFKNIIQTGERTYKCQELIYDYQKKKFDWRDCQLTLNQNNINVGLWGDIIFDYTLSKVE